MIHCPVIHNESKNKIDGWSVHEEKLCTRSLATDLLPFMSQNLYPDLIFPKLSATKLLSLCAADVCADESTEVLLETVIYRGGSRMDQWLHDGSALTYVK